MLLQVGLQDFADASPEIQFTPNGKVLNLDSPESVNEGWAFWESNHATFFVKAALASSRSGVWSPQDNLFVGINSVETFKQKLTLLRNQMVVSVLEETGQFTFVSSVLKSASSPLKEPTEEQQTSKFAELEKELDLLNVNEQNERNEQLQLMLDKWTQIMGEILQEHCSDLDLDLIKSQMQDELIVLGAVNNAANPNAFVRLKEASRVNWFVMQQEKETGASFNKGKAARLRIYFVLVQDTLYYHDLANIQTETIEGDDKITKPGESTWYNLSTDFPIEQRENLNQLLINMQQRFRKVTTIEPNEVYFFAPDIIVASDGLFVVELNSPSLWDSCECKKLLLDVWYLVHNGNIGSGTDNSIGYTACP